MVLPRSRHSDPAASRSRVESRSRVSRLVCLGAALTLAGGVAGCADEPAPEQAPPPVRADFPAATAGGACVFFDYETIEKAIGVRFGISAASHSGQTTTCVVQPERGELPDLALTISKTSVDAAVFKDDVVPDKGATTVKGLGLAAYQAPVAATDYRRAGP